MNINKPPVSDPISTPNPQDLSASHTINQQWQDYFSVENNELSMNFSNNGYLIPSISEKQLTNPKQVDNYGQSIVYNNDKNRLEINEGNRQKPAARTPNYAPIQTYQPLSTSEIQTEAIKEGNLGKIFVNSDTNELQFSLNGTTIRTITST